MKEFAKVKSGHDKGQIYVIYHEDEKYVYLADGRLKMTDHLKKKSRKHIQIIKNLPEEVQKILQEETAQEDIRIKRAIKAYRSKSENDKNGDNFKEVSNV